LDTPNHLIFADSVEGTASRTKDIYNKRLKKIVDTVVQGYNGTIFLYGQTTSGKTYTMLGTQKDPGVLPHSLRTLFMAIPKMKGYEFSVKVSYLEIYNELINDLLVPENTNLKILDDPNVITVLNYCFKRLYIAWCCCERFKKTRSCLIRRCHLLDVLRRGT